MNILQITITQIKVNIPITPIPFFQSRLLTKRLSSDVVSITLD